MNVRIDLLHGPHSMAGTLFSVIDILRTFNTLWQMRNPDKRGAFFHWRLIDAAGNELPLPGGAKPCDPRKLRCLFRACR